MVCFSPRHDLTLPQLHKSDIEAVLLTWKNQTDELGKIPEIDYVQVFENKGEMMGCSNPHPHSQIWATSYIPNEPAKEFACAFHVSAASNNSCLLCDYLIHEVERGERVVAEQPAFRRSCPFLGYLAFRSISCLVRHVGSLTDLYASEIEGLADLLQQITIRYDNLFEISFPYSMGFHQAPTDGELAS